MSKYNALFFLGMHFFLSVLIANEMKVHFSVEEKQQEVFWQFDVDFPEKQGIVYAQLLFRDNEIPKSRKRIWVKENHFRYVYGAVVGEVLSGIYTLKITYANSGKVFYYKKMVGSLYSEKKELHKYKRLITNFIDKTVIFFTDIEKDVKLNHVKKEHYVEMYEKKCVELFQNIDIISPPKVLFPHFHICVYYSQKIVFHKKEILYYYQKFFLNGKNKEFLIKYSHHKNLILKYVKNIRDEIEPKSIDIDTIKEDILFCMELFKTMDFLLVKASRENTKNLDEMVEYFLLEVNSWKEKVQDYKNAAFMKSHPRLLKAFEKIPPQMYELLCVYVYAIYTKQNLQIPQKIKINKSNKEQVYSKIIKLGKSISNYINAYEEQQKALLQAQHSELYREYNKIKMLVIDPEKNVTPKEINILKEKVKQISDAAFRVMFMDAIHHFHMLNKVKSQDDKLSNLYLLKYKTSLEVIERKLGYLSKDSD